MKLTIKEMALTAIGVLGSLLGCMYCIVILAAYFNLRSISGLNPIPEQVSLNRQEAIQ